MKVLLYALALAVSAAAAAAAPDAAALAHGRELLDEAVKEVAKVGREAAAKQIVAGGRWRVGSTYVVLNDFDAKVLAHSANAKMVGKVMREARDAAGKQFVLECLRNLQAKGESRVTLRWANPETKKFGDAVMLSKRVPHNDDLYVSVLVFP